MKTVTFTAPVNIAVVKYWGKRDDKLILPLNSSLSATLDQDVMCAKTTVACSKEFKESSLWLNGKREDINSTRIQNVIKTIKKLALEKNPSNEIISWNVEIRSCNNFPTAAGLASSAAGFACLVSALANLYEIEGDLSEIARQGSGSACRSVLGGWVAWDKGTNSKDSIARQIADENHWPDMRVLIIVVNAGHKSTTSTGGMARSVETSRLLELRAKEIVPDMMRKMEKAILQKNFDEFAELTMRDSNQLHAICLDTYPPISYMNDTSRFIQYVVHSINDFHQTNKVAYTFDAGPNACLYLLEENAQLVTSLLCKSFQIGAEVFRGNEIPKLNENIDSLLMEKINNYWRKFDANDIQHCIYTKVGKGPSPTEDHIKSIK
ncbi:DgyrCDS634 [Dimorphilus gyrociliatus]|uniref:Diphosphomevalonate decarboxylase n=1 Tax=Dimorphilus gyrociliatus TaxID=2664684 RepID=A0A7I8V582_9ANNE|nr:DgyrCDS634 [Dimorphilus gyrociliatus]